MSTTPFATELTVRLRDLQRRIDNGEPALVGDSLRESADEMERKSARENALTIALENLIEVADLAPPKNCSCHVSPPCNDCVEWGGLREALDNARSVLVQTKGRS